MRTQAGTVLAALQGAGRTAAAAESLTGGQVCVALSGQPGSSAVFLGGVVTYTVAAKQALLGIPAALLAEVGPVDPQVALAMAREVADRTGADIAVSTTGVAGPEPHGGHDPGFAYIGWTSADSGGVIEVTITGDRAAVRAGVTEVALEIITACAERGRVDARELSSGVEVPVRE